PLLFVQFYVFPCGHAFHSECLVENIRPHLSVDQQIAVASLVQMIAAGSSGGLDGKGSPGAAGGR
ncbi:unnamed protein product, partial [Hapterophycus canaliculatus]